MGNDLEQQSYLKRLQNSVFSGAWMQELYGKTRAEQQEQLKKVFTVAADNDITSHNKKALETQAETLQDKVERLEAKMAVLTEEMAKSEEEIAKRAKEITDLVASVEDKSDKMQDEQRKIVKYATEDVFYLYQRGKIGKDAITGEIRRRIEGEGVLNKYGTQIENLLGKLDGKQAQVQGLVDQAAKWMDQKNILESQFGATKSAYNMINSTIKQIGATETSYTNSDLSNDAPIYSPQELNTVAALHETYYAKAQDPTEKNTEKPTITSITEKYKNLLGQKNTAGDRNTYGNKAVQNLEAILKTDIFDEFMRAGAQATDVVDFFSTHFSGAGIAKATKVSVSSPWGHDEKARQIFANFRTKIESYGKGVISGGRTISKDNQLGKLQSFLQNGELDKLKNGGFTFKEAMFALFDKEKGLFNDTGIAYQYDKQADGLNYFVEYAGDNETAAFYNDLIKNINELWGVKPARTLDATADEPEIAPEPGPGPKPGPKTDPLSFSIDGADDKYSFVIDRDGDNKFDNFQDFVGADSNSTWLDDLKSLDKDGDGKLTGDELKELKVFGTKYVDGTDKTDNHKYDPNKVDSDKAYVREDETKVEYTLQTAAAMGITEIDLNGLEEQVNKSTGKEDLNGSEIFTDSFKFMMNGQEVTAHRQDDSEDFMKAIYGAADGKNFTISLTNGEANAIMKKDYGEFDEFDNRFAELFQNVEVLKSAGQLAQETRKLYNESVEQIEGFTAAELLKAGNRAAAETNVAGWNTVAAEIQQIAQKEGIVIDMTQAKGIYVLDASLEARGVVEKYKEQQAMLNDANTFELIQKEAWDAVVMLAQEGLSYNIDNVVELLMTGQAKTAQEIVAKYQQDYVMPEEEKQIATGELKFASDREKEVYESFNKAFNAVGLNGETFNALWDLCKAEMSLPGFMANKSGDKLAQYFLEKYGK